MFCSTRDNADEQETDSVLDQSVFSEDTFLDLPSSAPPAPAKKAKVTVDSLYQKFGETIENIESFLSMPEENTTDEAFMKTVVCLLKDLPVAMKDDFQERMLQELYKLRRENRSYCNYN